MSYPASPCEQPQMDSLQFQTVERASGQTIPGQGPQPASCVVCHKPIEGTYFAAGDKLVCPICRDKYVAATSGGSRMMRLTRATLFGIVAGLLGAAIWFAVLRMTGYNFALIAILVGFMVGGAVRAGSGRRGGRAYQLLAVLLTYLTIGTTYTGEAFYQYAHDPAKAHSSAATAGTAQDGSAAQADSKSGLAKIFAVDRSGAHQRPSLGRALLALVLLIALLIAMIAAMPVLSAHSIIGLLISGFALWEAWKINARRALTLAGPYSLAGVAGVPPAAQPSAGTRP